jgi:hypothetical protein
MQPVSPQPARTIGSAGAAIILPMECQATRQEALARSPATSSWQDASSSRMQIPHRCPPPNLIDQAALLLGPKNFEGVFGFPPGEKINLVDPSVISRK